MIQEYVLIGLFFVSFVISVKAVLPTSYSAIMLF
jgi:hypothetical protein